VLLGISIVPAASAQGHVPTYDELTKYEGTYESEHGATLQIAASPADTILFALIGGSKYPLRPVSEADTFTNVAEERVIFTRDDTGHVSGYRLPGGTASESVEGDQTFRRLSSGDDFPDEMWYPRLAAREPGYEYRYTVPEDLDDGLPVGSIHATDLDPSRVNAMTRGIINQTYSDVHSILLVKDGQLVLEEYFYEYDRSTPHQLRSATNSVVSALVGIAIDQGLIESTGSLVLPHFASDYVSIKHFTSEKEQITVGDLLTHQSGLACNDWNPDSPGNEVRMGQTGDWVKFILDLPMISKPGTEPKYCSGGVVVLGRLVEKLVGIPLEAFAERHLFGPLGIEKYKWRFEPDSSSAETFAQLYLRPRDMAKFGLLFSNDGRWNGHQVISEEWVETSTSSQATLGDTDYGYLWWRPYLHVPGGHRNAIAAQGNGGQEIYLWPELDMVAVLTGGNYNQSSPTNRLFIDHILPRVKANE
jgi:CubicO group peptidase (beta-lactamase class C family)